VLDAIAAFRSRYGARLDDPLFVRERCAEMSEEFAEVCQQHLVPARVVSGARFGEDEHFPGVTLLLAGHYATVVPCRWAPEDERWVGEVVIDWTAHQFAGPGTASEVAAGEVPWIAPLEEWRAIWRPIPTAQ